MTSFIADIAAAAEAMGAEADKVGLIMGVALTNWESQEQRDEFLSKVTNGG